MVDVPGPKSFTTEDNIRVEYADGSVKASKGEARYEAGITEVALMVNGDIAVETAIKYAVEQVKRSWSRGARRAIEATTGDIPTPAAGLDFNVEDALRNRLGEIEDGISHARWYANPPVPAPQPQAHVGIDLGADRPEPVQVYRVTGEDDRFYWRNVVRLEARASWPGEEANAANH